LRASKYGYSVARVRALKSFMLTEQDYEKLIKSEDLSDAIRKISGTIYAPYFKEVSQISWIEVEKRLIKALDDTYKKVVEMAPPIARKILELVKEKLELETLKQLIRCSASKLSFEKVAKLIVPLGKYDLEFSRKFLERELEEAIDLIMDEEIREVLKERLEDYERLGIATPLEVALDHYVFSKMLNEARKLPKLDRNYCEHLIGTEIDAINIVILVRGKAMKLKAADIEYMLIPEKYKLKREITAALGVEDPLEAYRLLASGYYIGKLPLRVSSIEDVERAVKKMIINESYKMFITYPFHAGLLYAFMNLKYYEIRDIRTILMGKYLGVEEDFIREHLLYTYKW